MISTRDLSELPSIPGLLHLCQSLAMLDAILMPEWDRRYYSFNSRWAPGEMMASMRDGCGDDYHILFDRHGAAVKGYAHESPMAGAVVRTGKPWPGVLDSVPADFARFLNQAAFSMDETTFCVWRRSRDRSWKVGKIDFPPGDDPDGSAGLLSILDGRPRTYQEWAEDYYERPVPLRWVKAVYRHEPLTERLVHGLNPDVRLDELKDDIAEIGYPG